MSPNTLLLIFIVLFFGEFIADWLLSVLNLNEILKNKDAVPQQFEESISSQEYGKSVSYSLEKGRFSLINRFFSFLILLTVSISGFPGMLENFLFRFFSEGIVLNISYILIFTFVYSLPGIPFSLYSQFVIEEKYGFNKMTLKLLLSDTLKQLILIPLLMIPLLLGLFIFMDKAGDLWWIYASAFIIVFQLVIFLIYPVVIAPLFNKFSPLEDGSLKERLNQLADRCQFETKGIFVMDGSRRSGHSNAYFTGLGKVKRIVLFDTLIDSLTEEELEAVLAHEIGHNKLKHIPKRLLISILTMTAAMYLINLCLSWEPLSLAFGFGETTYHSVLIILMYFASPFTFFFNPLSNRWSRKHEYEADAYACEKTVCSGFMASSLLRLSKDNLSNLTPHPLYSSFYYSHPVLAERLKAIDAFEDRQLNESP